MTSDQEIFTKLPSQQDPDWSLSVRKLGENATDEDLAMVVDDIEKPLEQRFAAFYVQQVRLRHNKDYPAYEQRVQQYSHVFSDQPMFSFMRAEYYGDAVGDPQAREVAIDLARQSTRMLPQSAGVWHLLAEYLLESVELSSTSLSEEDARERLLEADKAVSQAISLNKNYAKYYSTKGRILSLLGSDQLALQLLDQAIRLEDGSTVKGEGRIHSYQVYRREVALRRSTREAIQEQTKATEEFRALRSELLALLGLLAAVVAFISTTTSIATSMNLADALVLVLAVTASIIIVFAVFAALFVHNIALEKVWWAGGAGVVLAASATILAFATG